MSELELELVEYLEYALGIVTELEPENVYPEHVTSHLRAIGERVFNLTWVQCPTCELTYYHTTIESGNCKNCINNG